MAARRNIRRADNVCVGHLVQHKVGAFTFRCLLTVLHLNWLRVVRPSRLRCTVSRFGRLNVGLIDLGLEADILEQPVHSADIWSQGRPAGGFRVGMIKGERIKTTWNAKKQGENRLRGMDHNRSLRSTRAE